jgi:hypothetical protein
MGQIFLAGEESNEWASHACSVIANSSFKHGVLSLKGIEYGTLRNRLGNEDIELVGRASQTTQMSWKLDAHACDHGRV